MGQLRPRTWSQAGAGAEAPPLPASHQPHLSPVIFATWSPTRLLLWPHLAPALPTRDLTETSSPDISTFSFPQAVPLLVLPGHHPLSCHGCSTPQQPMILGSPLKMCHAPGDYHRPGQPGSASTVSHPGHPSITGETFLFPEPPDETTLQVLLIRGQLGCMYGKGSHRFLLLESQQKEASCSGVLSPAVGAAPSCLPGPMSAT